MVDPQKLKELIVEIFETTTTKNSFCGCPICSLLPVLQEVLIPLEKLFPASMNF